MTNSRLRPLLACMVLVVVVFAVREAASSDQSFGGTWKGLHVSGNRLVDKRGRSIQFHGVNRSGTEYSCVHGLGIFDGPSDARSVRAIARWHVNIVRVPLNEDCWLGINGVKPRYSGAHYQRAIVNYVRLLHRYRMYAEVSLVWAAPGNAIAGYQPNSPDEDHSPAVWAGMARTFKNDPNVILAPWGETTVSAGCFLNGCKNEATWDTPQDGDANCGPGCWRYSAAGMQQAVATMRRNGYNGVIAIPGVAFANDMSQWLSHQPNDPRHQLIAEAHIYGKNVCDNVACFRTTLAPVARRVPLIFGETGETYDGSDCGTRHISTIIGWADHHRIGYEAWTWDTWPNCSALINSYSGAPHAAFGAWIKARYTHSHPTLLGG